MSRQRSVEAFFVQAVGVALLLFLLFKAATWGPKEVVPMGEWQLAVSPGLVLIRYMPKHYFIPNIFAISKGDGFRFINETNEPLTLTLEEIFPTKDALLKQVRLQTQEFTDIRFVSRGVWRYYNATRPRANGLIYVR